MQHLRALLGHFYLYPCFPTYATAPPSPTRAVLPYTRALLGLIYSSSNPRGLPIELGEATAGIYEVEAAFGEVAAGTVHAAAGTFHVAAKSLIAAVNCKPTRASSE